MLRTYTDGDFKVMVLPTVDKHADYDTCFSKMAKSDRSISILR